MDAAVRLRMSVILPDTRIMIRAVVAAAGLALCSSSALRADVTTYTDETAFGDAILSPPTRQIDRCPICRKVFKMGDEPPKPPNYLTIFFKSDDIVG